MAEYIERDAVEKYISKGLNGLKHGAKAFGHDAVRILTHIHFMPAADVVSRTAYDQTAWERDTALQQLKSIGKGLGERMDDVAPVVRCKDCCHSYDSLDGRICSYGPCVDCVVDDDFWCKNGERENETK